MKKLNLPEYSFKVRKGDNTLYIFDPLRKKELVLTPEEWVRQNLIQYLIKEKSYPSGLISIEAGIKLNTLQKRYDILFYSNKGWPLVLVECKAPEVSIGKNVFEQILAYNSQVKAPFLIVSNGLHHYCLKRSTDNKFRFQNNIPDYSDITTLNS